MPSSSGIGLFDVDNLDGEYVGVVESPSPPASDRARLKVWLAPASAWSTIPSPVASQASPASA
jgi:hypothetical protein